MPFDELNILEEEKEFLIELEQIFKQKNKIIARDIIIEKNKIIGLDLSSSSLDTIPESIVKFNCF